MSWGGLHKDSNKNFGNRLSIFSLVLFLFFISSIILFAFYWNNQKKIKHYHISKMRFYDKKIIDSIIASKINQKDVIDELISQIERIEFVSYCKVYKKDSETLAVEIYEREPLALFKDTANNFWIVTTDYKVISSNFLLSKSFPIINDKIEPKFAVQKCYELLSFLKKIKQDYPEVYNCTAEIKKEGSNFHIVMKGTRTNILLESSSCSEKLPLLTELIRRRDFGKYFKKELDLRMENLIVVR